MIPIPMLYRDAGSDAPSTIILAEAINNTAYGGFDIGGASCTYNRISLSSVRGNDVGRSNYPVTPQQIWDTGGDRCFIVIKSAAGQQKDWIYIFGANLGVPPAASIGSVTHNDPSNPPPVVTQIYETSVPFLRNPFTSPGIAIYTGHGDYNLQNGLISLVMSATCSFPSGSGTPATTCVLITAPDPTTGILPVYRVTFPDGYVFGDCVKMTINGVAAYSSGAAGPWPPYPAWGLQEVPILQLSASSWFVKNDGSGMPVPGFVGFKTGWARSGRSIDIQMLNYGDVLNSVNFGLMQTQGTPEASFVSYLNSGAAFSGFNPYAPGVLSSDDGAGTISTATFS